MAKKSKKTKSKAKKKKNTANLGDTTISLLLVTLGLVFTVMYRRQQQSGSDRSEYVTVMNLLKTVHFSAL